MNEDNQGHELIIAHMNPEELVFLDQLQGGRKLYPGTDIPEYSDLADLPNDPQMRAVFEQASQQSNQQQEPQMMASGGMPKGLEELDTLKSNGRNGDSELALLPESLAHFFNELLGHAPINKDHMPEYFDMGSTLKSVGNFAGNTLARAAPYIGQGVGAFAGSALGGPLGEQIGGAVGRGLGRFGQGLWNSEGVGGSALQGAAQGGATYFQPQIQKGLGINPNTIQMNGTPREQGMQGFAQEATSLLPMALGAIGGPVGAGIGETLGNTTRGIMNGQDPRTAFTNGLKSGALEAGMPVGFDAIGSGFQSALRPNPIQTPPLQMPVQSAVGMAKGGMIDGIPEYWGLGSIFKSVARALPALIGGGAGFLVGGPMGAAVGAGLGGTGGGLMQGQSLGKSLGQGLIAGGTAYALPSVLGAAGNMFGSAGSQAAGNAMGSMPASAAGKIMGQGASQAAGQMGAQAAGNTAPQGILGSLQGGLGSILGGNALPLAAMTGMTYMGHRDEQKRLKNFENKEEERRRQYEDAYGTLKPFKMPAAKPRTLRPYEERPRYAETGGERQFFDEPPLFEAKGGMIPGMGKGQQDNIPAQLSPDEYVWDADSVQALGDGSSKAGAAILDRVRENLRMQKRASKKGIPPKAKPFEKYMPPKLQKKFVGLGR